MKTILCCAVLMVVGLACPNPAMAMEWADIHCSGTGNHTGGDPPQETPSSSTTQCHGEPGDSGSCTGVNTFSNYTISCYVTRNGSSTCTGSVSCTATNSSLSCGGRGYEVFAGVQAVGDGSSVGFIKCIRPDGSVYQEACNTGVV